MPKNKCFSFFENSKYLHLMWLLHIAVCLNLNIAIKTTGITYPLHIRLLLI